jgi:hypothetical protein
MPRANEQLGAKVGGLKQRIEVLEHENWRLSEANEVVKRDVGEVLNCAPKVKRAFTNRERELAKVKEAMRATRLKPDPLAPPKLANQFPPSVKKGKIQVEEGREGIRGL